MENNLLVVKELERIAEALEKLNEKLEKGAIINNNISGED